MARKIEQRIAEFEMKKLKLEKKHQRLMERIGSLSIKIRKLQTQQALKALKKETVPENVHAEPGLAQ